MGRVISSTFLSKRSKKMYDKLSPLRVLLGKPGLDGHDKGVKIIAYLLRDAGVEVIYTGLRKSIDQIVTAAIQEDVDIIALSILSGVHLELSQKLMNKLKMEKADDIPVSIGGVIPRQDIPKLIKIGIIRVFPVGSSLKSITAFFTERPWLTTTK